MIGVDLGSNTLRAVRIDCEELRILRRWEWIVRSAEELEREGIISKAAAERIREALCALRQEYPGEPIAAVATAAFRKAANAKELLEEIKKECGVSIQIIDAAQEAYYSARGIEFGLRRLGYDPQKFLAVDIGGGSTEIILKHRDELVSESFDIGILTTIQKYRTKEQILFGIKRKMELVRQHCLDLFEFFGKPKLFIGTGGTPTTVAALKLGLDYESYDPLKVDGTLIDRDDIQRAYRRLLTLPKERRAKLVGTGREDAIMAGLVILEEFLNKCGYGSMMVIDEGVREGVALEFCEKKESE